MKKGIAVMMLLAGGLFAAPRIRFGIGFGTPAPAVAVAQPPCPGPGYTWVNGYYASDGLWVNGYWAAPVVTVAPSYGYAGHFNRDDHARFDRDRGNFDRGDRGGHYERSNFARGGNDHGRR